MTTKNAHAITMDEIPHISETSEARMDRFLPVGSYVHAGGGFIPNEHYPGKWERLGTHVIECEVWQRKE